MNKKQTFNTYGKFEAASMNEVVRTVPTMRSIATSPASRTNELPIPVNKWMVLALSAAATFMTTLDGSIVNIGFAKHCTHVSHWNKWGD